MGGACCLFTINDSSPYVARHITSKLAILSSRFGTEIDPIQKSQKYLLIQGEDQFATSVELQWCSRLPYTEWLVWGILMQDARQNDAPT
jgi:hypothetical protein